MKLIREILYKVDIIDIIGDTSIKINKVEFNSKLIGNDDMYVAVNGVNVDGHNFINKAIKNGSICIICENLPTEILKDVVYIKVNSSRDALSIISSNYYDNPSSKINLIGITGTNGKTTVSTLLYELYNNLGIKSGLISTIKIMIDHDIIKSNQTTPDSLAINNYLNKMVLNNVKYCFMDVSSHGILLGFVVLHVWCMWCMMLVACFRAEWGESGACFVCLSCCCGAVCVCV